MALAQQLDVPYGFEFGQVLLFQDLSSHSVGCPLLALRAGNIRRTEPAGPVPLWATLYRRRIRLRYAMLLTGTECTLNPAQSAGTDRVSAAIDPSSTELTTVATDQGFRWYACYTRSRHEKRVAAALERAGQDVFLPMYPKVSKWHDRTRTVFWALFPGYVFVRCEPQDLTNVVLRIPGTVLIVSLAGKPVPIPETEIASVQRFAAVLAETGELPQPEPFVEEGWRVRVVEGPLAGVEGVVLQKRGKTRALVQVGVRAIGQGMKVELDAAVLDTIEKPESGGSSPGE